MARRCGTNRSTCGMSQGIYNPFMQGGRQWFGSGSGEVNSPFDTEDNTTEDGEQLWVWVGDSIALGTTPSGTDTSGAPYFASRYFNTTSNTIQNLTGELPTSNTGSMCPKFCTDYYRATGYKVCVLNVAFAGAYFYPNGDDNNYSVTGDNYGYLVAKSDLAKVALGVNKIRGIILNLGINDGRVETDLPSVLAAVSSLFDRFATDFPGVPVYVINIGTPDTVTQRIIDVQDAIEAEAVANPDWVKIVMRAQEYTTAPFRIFGDTTNVHPVQYGYDIMAGTIVRNMVSQNWASNRPISYTYSATSQQVFTRLGTVSDAEKRVLSDFIDYWVSSGEWAKNDCLYITTFGNPATRIKDLKRDNKPLTGGIIGTYGISTDGTIGNAIIVPFNPAVDGVNYTLNSAMAGVFLIDDVLKDTTTTHILFGIVGTTTSWQIRCSITTGPTSQYNINNGTGVATVAGNVLNGNTMHILSRTASNAISYHRNTTSNSATNASTGLPDRNMAIGASNSAAVNTPMATMIGGFIAGGTFASIGPSYKKYRELIVDLLVLQDPNAL